MNKIICGNSLEILKTLEQNSIDSIVTDPPYELGFMGKSWDASGIAYNIDLWKECLRVLKPGGHMLAFSGTRTYHRMTCAIEDAGFEIRDQIQWIYGSGFPKNLDISKQIDKKLGAERKVVGESKTGGFARQMKVNAEHGFRPNDYYAESGNKFYSNEAVTNDAKRFEGWGTALKPANEPICVARKPVSEKTIAENVLKYGTGGINIDECRIFTDDNICGSGGSRKVALTGDDRKGKSLGMFRETTEGVGYRQNNAGRWPANIIFDEDAAKVLDEQTGTLKSGSNCVRRKEGFFIEHGGLGKEGDVQTTYGDSGGASRFFYVAKASQKEKNQGLESRTKQIVNDGRKTSIDNAYQRGDTERLNIHPTVKPIQLMKYLITLVTPKGGTVLDPFLGSGTTALAAKLLGFDCVGIELSQEYVDIANMRLNSISKTSSLHDLFED